ncbi:MAG: hypothetical protein FJ336_02935 [Sphingomonadales bacterium]|nr:hypothetical protein [Sphingomonadales bacterium]
MKVEESGRWIGKEDHVLLFDISSRPVLVPNHPFNMGVANRAWLDASERKKRRGKRWNGVSPGMWQSPEWYEYLEATGGRRMVERYHPRAYREVAYIDQYFCSEAHPQQSLYEFAFSAIEACGAIAPRDFIASWTFSYQGQFSKISTDDEHSESDAEGPWLQMSLGSTGKIELIGVRPTYKEDGALAFTEDLVDLVKPITVYQHEQLSSPISVTSFSYPATKSFLNLVRHDLLRANVYLVGGDASRPLLAIRSLNRPLLWIPMAQGTSECFPSATERH